MIQVSQERLATLDQQEQLEPQGWLGVPETQELQDQLAIQAHLGHKDLEVLQVQQALPGPLDSLE